MEPCNEFECDFEFVLGPWSQCSVSCGGGFRSRSYFCQDGVGRIAESDSVCDDLVPPPALQEACNTEPCPLAYFDSYPTGECSEDCAITDSDSGLVTFPRQDLDVHCNVYYVATMFNTARCVRPVRRQMCSAMYHAVLQSSSACIVQMQFGSCPGSPCFQLAPTCLSQHGIPRGCACQRHCRASGLERAALARTGPGRASAAHHAS